VLKPHHLKSHLQECHAALQAASCTLTSSRLHTLLASFGAQLHLLTLPTLIAVLLPCQVPL
jgi:hypothetical protein